MPDLNAELDAFIDTLRTNRLVEGVSDWTISRAPGRLDVMGGIADYSGSLVLQRPIAEGTFAAVGRLERPVLEIVSIGRPPCTIPLETLAPAGAPIEYHRARKLFTAPQFTAPHWVSYVAGVVLALARECAMPLDSGARIVVMSRVPEGKGVSSSAAIETAVMSAVAGTFGVPLAPRDLALLCQKAENLVAGAPCGVMDQMTCVCGTPDALLALLCQPAELQPSVPVPEDVGVWGLDSGERHAVGGSDYGAVRTGAFMGLRILSEHIEVPGGYLANLDPGERERERERERGRGRGLLHELLQELPEEMSGDEFIERYGQTSDTVTSVDRQRRYRVRTPTAHPVYERRRAERFRALLGEPCRDDASRQARLIELGALMSESHAGYGACGLGSSGTDLLAALVRAEGPAAGLYGARITGGGSGGTVAVIGRSDASPAIERVAEAYERKTGHRPHVFAGSSSGTAAFGVHVRRGPQPRPGN